MYMGKQVFLIIDRDDNTVYHPKIWRAFKDPLPFVFYLPFLDVIWSGMHLFLIRSAFFPLFTIKVDGF